MNAHGISRRQFLKAAGTLGAAGALAARAAPAQPGQPAEGAGQEAPAPAPAAAEPTTISLWWWTAEPWNSAANTYNTVQDKIKINLS